MGRKENKPMKKYLIIGTTKEGEIHTVKVDNEEMAEIIKDAMGDAGYKMIVIIKEIF